MFDYTPGVWFGTDLDDQWFTAKTQFRYPPLAASNVYDTDLINSSFNFKFYSGNDLIF